MPVCTNTGTHRRQHDQQGFSRGDLFSIVRKLDNVRQNVESSNVNGLSFGAPDVARLELRISHGGIIILGHSLLRLLIKHPLTVYLEALFD